ncbi:hypothetical protein [Penaeicola halotolerans]|uniref:hypothetical protein n=1 Tax=Penaeicola halotolerans TaxID=2793196 RepID=UPI001CF86AFB|nr:hypothetical protein [Penaeicola halotolerans]
MKKYILTTLLVILIISPAVFAQSSGSFLISSGLDVYKTDNTGIADKVQFGLEGNYFVTSNFTFTGGVDFWSQGPNSSIIIGSRFYPIEPLFLRFRGLLRDNSDIALGAGYQVPISYRLRLEGMADYYMNQRELGLRIGLAFLIN